MCPGVAEVLGLAECSGPDCGFVHGEPVWEKRGFKRRVFFLPEHETERSLVLGSPQGEMTSSLESELLAARSRDS